LCELLGGTEGLVETEDDGQTSTSARWE